MTGIIPSEIQPLNQNRDLLINDGQTRDNLRVVVSRGSFARTIRIVTEDESLDPRFSVFLVDTTAAGRTVTLPLAGYWGASTKSGIITIANYTGSNTVTVNITSPDNFNDSSTSFTLVAGEVAHLFSDGNAVWFVDPVALVGTWTPVLTFGTPGDLAVTYAAERNGHYVKLGKAIDVSYAVTTSSFTHTTASGNLLITGLPFTSTNASNYVAVGPVSWQGITKAGYTDIDGTLFGSSTQILFTGSASAGSISAVSSSDVPTGGTVILRGNMRYRII